MDQLSQYSSCLSKVFTCPSQWQLNAAPGWQAVGAWTLMGAGGLFILCKALTFVRVLLSLLVLPGKSVSQVLTYSTKLIANMRFRVAPLIRPQR